MNSVYLFLRLAILAFYPDNTKISFDETTITFRPPSMSQGVLRWVYGESRNDILCIKNHILNMIHFFGNGNFKRKVVRCWFMEKKKRKAFGPNTFCFFFGFFPKKGLNNNRNKQTNKYPRGEDALLRCVIRKRRRVLTVSSYCRPTVYSIYT